jgi:hypothetical protein
MCSFRGNEPKIHNYTAYVVCENCNFRGEIELEVGMLINRTRCPECGNSTLEREIEPSRKK